MTLPISFLTKMLLILQLQMLLNHNFPEYSQKSSLEVEQEPGETNQPVTTRKQPPLLRSGYVEPDRVYGLYYDLKVSKRGIGKTMSALVNVVSKNDLALAPSDV
jgi:hypothetical protein